MARNEAIARDINEAIEESLKTNTRLSSLCLICECADASCEEVLAVTIEEYEEIRQHPRQFAVRQGHIVADIEFSVRETTNFVVVQKREGIPAEVVEAENPRR